MKIVFSLNIGEAQKSEKQDKDKELLKRKKFYAQKLEEISDSYAKEHNEYEGQFNSGILTATLAFLGLFFGFMPNYKTSDFSGIELLFIITTLSAFVLSMLFWLIDYLLTFHFYAKKHKHCFETHSQIESAKSSETIDVIEALSLEPMNNYQDSTSPKWAKVTQIVLFVLGIALCSIFVVLFLLS